MVREGLTPQQKEEQVEFVAERRSRRNPPVGYREIVKEWEEHHPKGPSLTISIVSSNPELRIQHPGPHNRLNRIRYRSES